MIEKPVGRTRYYTCFRDDYSKYRRVFFITTKSKVADCLRKFLKEVKIAGHVTKVLLSEGGKEFNCETVQEVLEEYGITHRLAMPFIPEQNGAAEQENRTIVESPRSMFRPVDCRKNCGLRPVTLQYTLTFTCHTPVEDKIHSELWIGLYLTLGHLRILGQNIMCTAPNRKGTGGTLRVRWVDWSDIWVKRTAIEFGFLTNERLCWAVKFSLSQAFCAIRATTKPKKTESVCPTTHVAPTEASDILQIYKSDDGYTASSSGGRNGSNSEIHVQDRKRALEKKEPNWMSCGEFVCLVNDIQGG